MPSTSCGFETREFDRGLTRPFASMSSERHGLTSYDAAYLALAIVDGWVARDIRCGSFGLAAGTRAFTIGPARLSEAPAPYEHAVTWPNYKGASAFLAKLRAEAARPG